MAIGNALIAEFLDVTEIGGQLVSQEQLERVCHRYHWAARDSERKDVLEVACGAGQGLSILRGSASGLAAGDCSREILEIAQAAAPHVALQVFAAEALPFEAKSFDRIILFEALYYVDADAFFSEARRVLRQGGSILIATANKDLYDFTPSPFATHYLGAIEMTAKLSEAGFDVELYGYLNTAEVSIRQRLLRPVKAFASRMGLIPRSLRGREWMKKIFFGSMVHMPATLVDVPFDYSPPSPIPCDVPDRRHKVIYCRATVSRKG